MVRPRHRQAGQVDERNGLANEPHHAPFRTMMIMTCLKVSKCLLVLVLLVATFVTLVCDHGRCSAQYNWEVASIEISDTVEVDFLQ